MRFPSKLQPAGVAISAKEWSASSGSSLLRRRSVTAACSALGGRYPEGRRGKLARWQLECIAKQSRTGRVATGYPTLGRRKFQSAAGSSNLKCSSSVQRPSHSADVSKVAKLSARED